MLGLYQAVELSCICQRESFICLRPEWPAIILEGEGSICNLWSHSPLTHEGTTRPPAFSLREMSLCMVHQKEGETKSGNRKS